MLDPYKWQYVWYYTGVPLTVMTFWHILDENTRWENCGFDFVWPEISWGIFSSTCCIFASFCCDFSLRLHFLGSCCRGERGAFPDLRKQRALNWRESVGACNYVWTHRSFLYSFLAVLVVCLTSKLTSGWASWHLRWSQAASPHAETSLKHKHDFIYTVIYNFQC